MFYEPILIDPVSIRGRMAFGVTCLESVCTALRIESKAMQDLIEVLWRFTESKMLGEWEGDICAALPAREGDVEAYTTHFGLRHLNDAQQRFVTGLIDTVIEVGRGNLYAGFVSVHTRDPTFKIAVMLHERGFAVPDIQRFAISSVEEFHGWGNPISREAFHNHE
jgi:hypothetical protein